MEKNLPTIDLTKGFNYEVVDHKIDEILDLLFHNYKVNEKRVKEIEQLFATFVNKISDTLNEPKITRKKKRTEAYRPLYDYVSILNDENIISDKQGEDFFQYVLELETIIYKNLTKSYNKHEVNESISRKWQ